MASHSMCFIEQDFDRRLGFRTESFDLPHDFHHLLHVLRTAAEHQHVEPVDHFHLHRVYDPGKVAEVGRLFAETRPRGARKLLDSLSKPEEPSVWEEWPPAAGGVGPRLHEQGCQGQGNAARRWPFA